MSFFAKRTEKASAPRFHLCTWHTMAVVQLLKKMTSSVSWLTIESSSSSKSLRGLGASSARRANDLRSPAERSM